MQIVVVILGNSLATLNLRMQSIFLLRAVEHVYTNGDEYNEEGRKTAAYKFAAKDANMFASKLGTFYS